METHQRKAGLEFTNELFNRRDRIDGREVADWMSSGEHIRLLDESAMMHRVLAPEDFSGMKRQEWLKMQKRISSPLRHALLRVAVAASVFIVLSLGFWFFYASPERQKPHEGYHITPGDYRAELILDDGERIPLSMGMADIRMDGLMIARNDSAAGLNYMFNELSDTASSPRYNTLRVPAGGFYSLRLSDGSRVWLNAASELRYPVSFSREEREVYLKGEAYFEVEKNAEQPFKVYLEDAHVKVLGTAFNVQAYPDEGKVFTTLKSGSVAFFADKINREVILNPGEQSEMSTADGEVTVRMVDTEIYSSWKDGIFYFKGMNLGEIMRMIARWYQVEIVYMNPGLEGLLYQGKMPMYSGIEDVLRKIELSGGVRFEIRDKTIMVFEK